MIRVLELFAGIGACSKALERLGIEHEIVDAVEIDKYAIKAFNAIHHTNFEAQDITTWDKDIECDLIMHGSPCQDFSIAGKQAGGDMESGTRSSLMYETLRIVEKLKPKYVIWENVKNLLSKKHRHNFDTYLERMIELGYTSYYQVLNAKDYGVPQNRERVFTVSIRKDYYYKIADGQPCEKEEWFKFPEKQPLEKRLKDVLETKVDEKYYLSDAKIDMIKKWKCYEKPLENTMTGDSISGTLTTRSGAECGGMKTVFVVASRGRGANNEQQLEPRKDGMTNTITSVQKDNYVAIKTGNKKGYDYATDGDGIDLAYPNSTTRRGRVGHGVAKTIPTGSGSQGVLDEFRIRKLTPRECFRLMGFDDKDFDACVSANVSNSQLYKIAGNSIVVNVLEYLLTNLIRGEE